MDLRGSTGVYSADSAYYAYPSGGLGVDRSTVPILAPPRGRHSRHGTDTCLPPSVVGTVGMVDTCLPPNPPRGRHSRHSRHMSTPHLGRHSRHGRHMSTPTHQW